MLRFECKSWNSNFQLYLIVMQWFLVRFFWCLLLLPFVWQVYPSIFWFYHLLYLRKSKLFFHTFTKMNSNYIYFNKNNAFGPFYHFNPTTMQWFLARFYRCLLLLPFFWQVYPSIFWFYRLLPQRHILSQFRWLLGGPSIYYVSNFSASMYGGVQKLLRQVLGLFLTTY